MKRIPVIFAAAVLLAGCGDKSPSTTASNATSNPTASSAATSSAAANTSAGAATTSTAKAPTNTAKGATTSAGKLPVACVVVTKADIAAAYGTTSSDGSASDDADNTCDFTISGTSKAGKVDLFDEVSVGIDTRDSDSGYDRVKVVFPNAVKVDIGDEAYSLDTIVYQLHILKGRFEMVIAGPLLADKAASKQIVDDLGRTLVGRL